MDLQLPTLVTYIDFRKAFDCVQHPTLLNKLAALNLDSAVVDWVGTLILSPVGAYAMVSE